MRKDEVPTSLSVLAFDFFYCFSRFEFSLKENGYLKSHTIGKSAEPGWDDFVAKWQSTYLLSVEAIFLMNSPPEKQVVLQADTLDWRPVNLADCKSDLSRVVRLVKTVRNNLFHGGKHGGSGWDDPSRTEALLVASRAILGQFATLASIEDDYTGSY